MTAGLPRSIQQGRSGQAATGIRFQAFRLHDGIGKQLSRYGAVAEPAGGIKYTEYGRNLGEVETTEL